MKIALVYPPSFEENLKGYPLGLAYLSAVLKRSHDVFVYNYNGRPQRRSVRDFLKAVRDIRPDVVGISFNSFNRGAAYRIIRGVKKVHPRAVVVLGGVHPATMVEQMFRYFYASIDFIVLSEGEIPFDRLCRALEKGEDPRAIPGLVCKDGRRGFRANPPGEKIRDLDTLPLPDYSYAAAEIRDTGLAYLITSRGCPVNCTFCSTSSFWGQKIRACSPERIGEEVAAVKRLGARKIFFHDDTFNLGIERTLKVAAILKKLDIEYAVSCRVRPVSEDMIRALAESGCRYINWGVESLSDTILQQINKRISKEEVKRAFDICARFSDRLGSGAYCCVGLPGESDATVRETVDYMNTNIRSTHGPSASMLYILPGTEVYRRMVREGRMKESMWVRSGSVYYTPEYSIGTLNRWRKQINRSGIRIPTGAPGFWDCLCKEDEVPERSFRHRANKFWKSTKRNINLLHRRY